MISQLVIGRFDTVLLIVVQRHQLSIKSIFLLMKNWLYCSIKSFLNLKTNCSNCSDSWFCSIYQFVAQSIQDCWIAIGSSILLHAINSFLLPKSFHRRVIIVFFSYTKTSQFHREIGCHSTKRVYSFCDSKDWLTRIHQVDICITGTVV
jgi:hypothetical protein